MKSKIIIVTLLVISLGISNFAYARKGGRGGAGGMPHGKWWNRPEVAEKLTLTNSQTEKLQTIMITHQKKLLDLRNEISKLELDLDTIMNASKFDAGAAKGILSKIDKYRSEAMAERSIMLVEFREVLSKDQYQKLKEIKGRRGGRKGKRGEMREGKKRESRQLEE